MISKILIFWVIEKYILKKISKNKKCNKYRNQFWMMSNHVWVMPEALPKHWQYTGKTFPTHSQIMYETFPTHVGNMTKSCLQDGCMHWCMYGCMHPRKFCKSRQHVWTNSSRLKSNQKQQHETSPELAKCCHISQNGVEHTNKNEQHYKESSTISNTQDK